MPLEERTGVRDLTFSRWHRGALPRDVSWIDIDSLHYCKYCLEPLGLFELVRSDAPDFLEEDCRRKVATMTERVGVRLGIPAFKIAYCGNPLQMAAVQTVGRFPVDVCHPAKLARFINDLHDCAFCRQHRGGRFAVHRSPRS